MNRILSVLAAAGLAMAGAIGAGSAQEAHSEAEPTHFPINKPTEQAWTFAGPFGTYDGRSCSAA